MNYGLRKLPRGQHAKDWEHRFNMSVLEVGAWFLLIVFVMIGFMIA